MFLLDTNVISELRKAKAGRAHPAVTAWAQSVPTASLYISVITVMELELGIGLLAARDHHQYMMLRTWMDNFVMPAYAGRTLDVTVPIAQKCAELHIPKPRPERDALIAATAVHHRMTVVTRNTDDFEGMVGTLNPWMPA
jgi:predicted nucleic acid-binding protein